MIAQPKLTKRIDKTIEHKKLQAMTPQHTQHTFT